MNIEVWIQKGVVAISSKLVISLHNVQIIGQFQTLFEEPSCVCGFTIKAKSYNSFWLQSLPPICHRNVPGSTMLQMREKIIHDVNVSLKPVIFLADYAGPKLAVQGITIFCHFRKNYLMPVIICKNDMHFVTLYNVICYLSHIFY